MAERRMFAKTIVLSDPFLDMPCSARCLYFTFGMLADDDGFVNSPKSIMRQCGATDDDLKILIAKRYIIAFEDGLLVIKHWRINNYLQKDRYHETVYLDEKSTLNIDENGVYTQPVYNMYTQDRLDKDRLDKVIDIGATLPEPRQKRFQKPTVDEVRAYCIERNNGIDASHFVDYYDSIGWKIGSKPMKDWRATIRTWERRDKERKESQEKDDGRLNFNLEEIFEKTQKEN